MVTDLQVRLQTALGDAYRIERELTRGGMSRLFLATEASLNRRVVIKVLPPELTSQVSTERFRQEIELAAHLQHPNILPVLAAGTREGLLYYVTPYIPGESLRHRLTREGQLPVGDAIRILHEIADALAYAHGEGVIHRDIKPENILLEGNHAVLTDFGVARALGESQSGARLTDSGFALGTPGYMAPEQAAGERQVDGRADVYALAVVGYEMLAGVPPYTGPTAHAVTAAQFRGPPKPLVEVRPETPAHVSGVIARGLIFDPGMRLQTATELRDSLDPVRPHLRVRGPSKRLRRLAAASLVLLLGAGGLLFFRRNSTAALNPNLLAVAPFEVLDPALELWREGLVDLLSRNLDGAGPLRTVPPTTVIRGWSGRADHVAASALAQQTGARLTVFGSLVPAGGDSVRLRATLFDASSGRSLADLELRDATARIDRLSDSLTIKLLAELGRNRRIELTRVASLGSTSLPALKAFLQGEQWFRRTAWDSALASYETAVRLDSSFTLALWRLSRVAGWQRVGFDSLAIALAIRAGELNRGLAPRDSLLIAADSSMSPILRDGQSTWAQYASAIAAAREAVRRYPDDADVWHTLGEVQLHLGLDRDVPLSHSLASFDRAISLDSAYAPAYIHAIEVATHLHGWEVGRKYALEYLKRAPGDVTAAGIRLALALTNAVRGQQAEVQRALQKASTNVLFKAWLVLMAATDSGEAGIKVARAMAAAPDSSAPWLPRDFRRAALSVTLAYRGHLREAMSGWRADNPFAASLLGQVALLVPAYADTADTHFRRWLRSDDLGKSSAGIMWFTSRRDSLSLERFERLADSISRSTTDLPAREEALYYVAAARAYQTLARGDSLAALRQFGSLPDSLCAGCQSERLTRLLVSAARRQDRNVVETDWPWSYYPSLRSVVARIDQGRAAERLDERERAVSDYRFVAEVWRHADAELQPYVTEARQALARLTSEPRR